MLHADLENVFNVMKVITLTLIKTTKNVQFAHQSVENVMTKTIVKIVLTGTSGLWNIVKIIDPMTVKNVMKIALLVNTGQHSA